MYKRVNCSETSARHLNEPLNFLEIDRIFLWLSFTSAEDVLMMMLMNIRQTADKTTLIFTS